MHEHLLKPSLSRDASAPAATLYSTQSSFLVAFLGGAAAIVLYSALNSWRLRRPVDSLAYLATLAVMVLMMIDEERSGSLFTWFIDYFGRGSERYLWRLLALAAFGVFYLMHRKQHRSTLLFGAKAPAPWIPAIVCMVAGFGINVALLTVIRMAA
jgi:hypothetical protein